MKNSLLVYLFSILLGAITTQYACAQDKYIPKYLRENDKTFLQLTTSAKDDGWIEFRRDKDAAAIDPDTFFDRFGRTIGLGDNYQMKLVVGKDETDDLKIRHQRFQLYFKNIRVQGVEFTLHSRNKRLETAHGRIVENLSLDVSKPIPERQALNLALLDQKLSFDAFNGKQLPIGELVITKINDEVVSQNFKFCYAFEIRAAGLDRILNIAVEPQRVYVDAITGLVVRHDPLVHNCFGTSSHPDPVKSLNALADGLVKSVKAGDFFSPSTFNPNRSRYLSAQGGTGFETEQIGSQYRLSLQNTDLNVRDAAGDPNPYYTSSWQGKPDIFNTSPGWGNNVPNATTAHWLTQRVHQFYYNQFNRNGYDGAGKYPYVLVNVGDVNAAWDLDRTIGFGFAPNNSSYVVADVLGHEYTHALTQNTANLEYVAESGALNEAISDIFGTAFERYLFPDPNTSNPTNWNYRIAEDAATLRNMANPGEFGQPSSYLGSNWIPRTSSCTAGPYGNDLCGVHINSGVMNKWFHALCTGQGANGQSVSIVSFDDAIQIVYRALRYYLQRTSQYTDARNATASAARDLFGGCSPQEKAVWAAWATANLPAPYQCYPGCDLNPPTITGSPNVNCNQTVTLTANCNANGGSSGCQSLLYRLRDGNGSYLNTFVASGGTAVITITAPSSAGSYLYYIGAEAQQSSGPCFEQRQPISINVSCSVTPPPPPPTGGGDCQAFSETCSGNDQEISYVTLNVATAGNYPLTITYKSGEKPVDALVRVGSASTAIHFNQTATYTTATTSGSVFLNQGVNTIGLSSGTGGGYVCFTNICTGSGGGNPPPANCDFNMSVNSANATCNQTGVQLTASCSGANCDGLSYSWTGGQSGQTASFNAGASNGSTTYTVTVARSGCSNKTASGSINVSGCGGGTPPAGGAACQSFNSVCSGNAQEIQYVTLNVATAGSYPLTITYTSHEKAVDAQVVVGNNTTPIHYDQTTYGTYTTASTGSVYLNQGANTIGLSSGSAGGYICFTNVCAGNGSGRLGTSEITQEDRSLVVLPNPSRGATTVRFRLEAGETGRLSVVSMQGKELLGRSVVGTGAEQSERLELSSQVSGLYLIRLEGRQSGSKTAKLILER